MGSSASTAAVIRRPSMARREVHHVVIVGGGYAGVSCAIELQMCRIPFTLIDPKEYFHHNIGSLRAAVTKDNYFAPQTMIDFEPTFGGDFIQGTVISVDLDDRSVIINDNDRKVNYTHLVLATGTTAPFPMKTRAKFKHILRAEYDKTAAEVEKAEVIVVIGGGATGVELCGELSDVRRRQMKLNDSNSILKQVSKKIILMHSGGELLDTYPMSAGAQKAARVQLETKGIKIILESRVINMPDLSFGICKKQTAVTKAGKNIQGDLFFNCTGMRVDTELTDEFFSDYLDEYGHLEVSKTTLKVGDLENVYGIGDVTDLHDVKLGLQAQEQGTFVAKNIVREIAGRCIQDFDPHPRLSGMIVTIGQDGGVGWTKEKSQPAMAVSLLKGTSLYTEKFWALMNQKKPVG